MGPSGSPVPGRFGPRRSWTDEAPPEPAAPAPPARPWYLAFLSLAALGVVYGDIGTSPLYAIRESFAGHFGVAPTPENVLGVLSLVTWSLTLIVAVKYILIVIRADNEGEGGILALTALITPQPDGRGGFAPALSRNRKLLVWIGLFGAALLYGDGMLTPAISVLSAVEGLEVLRPSLASAVVPIALVLLVGLFLVQRHGTAGVGRFFGPIMLVWFATLAALGIRGILLQPHVLYALNPLYAVLFFQANGLLGLLVLGAVFLVVTGGEALYADLGHFGKGVIQIDWFAIVFPALLLNYFGQGALVLSNPEATANPFYLLAPHGALLPLIILSTAATIIASQAVISGVFSLTMQAVQLGYWPRTAVRHTSASEFGQIYVPSANWALLIGTVVLVLAFRSSSAMAAAYGVAIVCTMIVTTLLLYVVVPERWGWPRWLSVSLLTVFLLVELAFLGANLVKIHEGGWVSLVLATALFALVTTWQYGRRMLGLRIGAMLQPLQDFLDGLEWRVQARTSGTAVYMTGNPRFTPPPLALNLEHQKSIHERVVLLTVTTERVPHVKPPQRVTVEPLNHGFFRATARYGFMENPNMLEVLDHLREAGLDLRLADTTFFLGRERVLAGKGPLVSRWRIGVFSFMTRNSQRATAFFNIPSDRVVEIGSHIEV